MFCTQVTPEQMKEQSRLATEAGLLDVAQAIKEKHTNSVESLTQTESESDSSGHYRSNRRDSRKRSRSERSIDPQIARLETRNRYMQLEVANAMTTVQEYKEKMEEMSLRIQPYTKANTQLAVIHWLREGSFKGVEEYAGLSITQLESKIRRFDKESKEHIALCSDAISEIQHQQIKFALERVLSSETRRIEKRVKKMKLHLFCFKLVELFFKAIVIGLIIGAIAGVIHYMRL